MNLLITKIIYNTMKKILFLSVILLLTCKERNKIVGNLTSNKELNYNFDKILKCSNFVWDEYYYFTPDYGCIYNPKGINEFGNLSIYLFPLEVKDTTNVNNVTPQKIKQQYHIIISLIKPKDLNFNPEGDPVYYKNENYIEYFYTLKNKKWIEIDAIKSSDKDRLLRRKEILNFINLNEKFNDVTISSNKIYNKEYKIEVRTTKNKIPILTKNLFSDSVTIKKTSNDFQLDMFYMDRYGNESKKINIPIQLIENSLIIDTITKQEYFLSAKTGEYKWRTEKIKLNSTLRNFNFYTLN